VTGAGARDAGGRLGGEATRPVERASMVSGRTKGDRCTTAGTAEGRRGGGGKRKQETGWQNVAGRLRTRSIIRQ